MSEYAVGLDRLYSIEAESAEEAEQKLANLLDEGGLDVDASDCMTYEELPE